MTGLYNRRFLEEELHRIDTKSNLPISVIIGDINCLKLTNDIFGHSHGDILIKKVSQVMSKVCKKEDVIVRCGGDEFLILLPKTGITEVKKIMERIRNETEKEQIKAIKGSISMGADTKESESINIWDTIDRAEEDMYIAKTLGRDEVKRDTINSIINNLHQNNPREKEHSIHVKRLCQNMAEILNLSDIDTKKLKDAGYLHDIGKIVLESRLLENNYSIMERNKKASYYRIPYTEFI
jgi:diguanylate cyclase (GGDEF)-like protein